MATIVVSAIQIELIEAILKPLENVVLWQAIKIIICFVGVEEFFKRNKFQLTGVIMFVEIDLKIALWRVLLL